MEFLVASIPSLTVAMTILVRCVARRRRTLRYERKTRLLILALR